MLSLSAALPRPAARFIITLGVVVGLVANSWQSPKSLAEGLPRPLQTDLTRQIVASGDDVNEDGSSYYPNSGTVWLGTGASTAASYTGLRFTNIAIPQGATITSAKLQVYLPSSAWNQLSFTYAAENVGNSSAFSSSNRPSQRTLTAQTVSHSSDVEWPATTWYDLDEISSVVQPVISRADWSSGNALSIILKGTGDSYGRKFVTAYDGTPANAIRLMVTYSTGGATPTHTSVAPTATRTATRTSTPVGPTATATSSGGGSQLTRQILALGDDVNEDGTDFYEDSDTVWLGTGASAAASYTGLRFTNIAIPQGATITSAKLQVYLPSSSWNYLSFTYAAENAGNSAAFSSSNRPSQRALTTQTVTHASDVNWPANTWIDLDEISSVVQPVISRSDWASGNAFSIILKGVGGAYGRKFVTAYDGTAANAVRLVISYAASTSTPTRTFTPSATPTRTHSPTATQAATATATATSSAPTSTPTTLGGDGYPGPGEPEHPAVTGPYRVMVPLIDRGVPASTFSRYMSTVDSAQLYNLGAARGGCNSSGQTPTGGGLVVLAFGQAWKEGTTEGVALYLPPDYPFVSTTQVATGMRSFIRGYVDCVKAKPGISLTVAVGVNNSNITPYVTASHGTAWANMVNSLRSYINDHTPEVVTINGQSVTVTWASKIHVIGGVDFEPLFGPKDRARNWITGYDSVNEEMSLNFGSCDRCPNFAYSTNTRLTTEWGSSSDWWTDDIWYLSYGASPSYALPEIYTTNSSNARQWAYLSNYAATCASPCEPYPRRGAIPYQGVMTQLQSCLDNDAKGSNICDAIERNAPKDGWIQLIKELTNAGFLRPTLKWLTDISSTK